MATLPTILIMATIVMEIAVGAVVIAVMLNSSSFNRKVSSEALELARTGVQDGLIYVNRFCSSVSGCTHSYTLTLGENTVDVDIVDGGGGIVTITSTGHVGTRAKRVQAIVGIDASTAQVQMRSYEEVAL